MNDIRILNKDNKREIYKFILTFFFGFLFSAFFLTMFLAAFGYSSLRSDAFLLYVPNIRNIFRSICSGKGVYYSFNSFLGSGNAFNLADEFFSPFNLLFLIFYKLNINITVILVISLKIGVSALTFRYFVARVIKYRGIGSVIISIFYANCAFSIAYGTVAFYWLDSVIILPVIFVGLYELIFYEKRVLLIASYSYLFITQFYMAYMVGVISFFAYVIYLVIFYDFNKVKFLFSKLFNYFLCVVISGLLSAFVWVPTLFFILANRVPDSSTIENLSINPLSVFNGLFVGMNYGIMGYLPYVYCGLPVLLLSILFFVNKKISKKTKFFSALIIVFFVLCMTITPLNIFLHVFDQPDLMHFRYSFVFSFIICAISAYELANFEKIGIKKIVLILCVLSLFYFIMIFISRLYSFYDNSEVYLNTDTGLIINIALLSSWCVFGYWILYKNNSIFKRLSLILVFLELSFSSYIILDGKADIKMINKWNNSMSKAVNSILENDNDLFRVISANDYSINSDFMFGYNGISDMGDQEEYNVRKFLSNIGFATSVRFIDDTGYNPVSEMLLGVKYIINTPESYYSSVNNNNKSIEVLKNDYYLGMGYMIKGNLVFYEYSSRDVFENMNDIISFMSGADYDCFVRIPKNNIRTEFYNISMNSIEDGYEFVRLSDEDGIINFLCDNNEYDDIYFQLEKQKPNLSDSDYRIVGSLNRGNIFYSDYASLSSANLMRRGNDNVSSISLVSFDVYSPKDISFNDINIYGLDKDALKKHYDILKNGQLFVYEYRNGYIKGKVNVSDGKRVLFMSLPYDPGWTAYIDGNEAHIIRLIDGTFMGLMFGEDGEHTVEFKYECPGLKIGIIVSALGLIAFLSVIYEKKLKNIKIK